MADSGGIRAGLAFVELYANDSALVKGLNAAQAKLRAFGNAVKAVGIGLTALGASAITPILASAKSFAEAADALDKMSKRTGVGVEALSQLSYAAAQSGTSAEELEVSIKKMERTIFSAREGSEQSRESLRLLGLSMKDLKGLSPEDQFALIGKKIDGIQDPTRKAAIAMEIFGKSGTSILPMLHNMEALRIEAASLGATMTKEDVAAGVELMNVYRMLKAALQGVANAIGSAVAPTLTEYGGYVVKIVATTSKWIRENKETVVMALKIAAAVFVAGSAFLVFGYGLVILGQIFGTISALITTGISLITTVAGAMASVAGAAFGALGTVIAALATPVGVIFIALVALFGTLLELSGIADEITQSVSESFSALADTAKSAFGAIKAFALEAFQGIKDALAAGDIALAGQILWSSLKVVFYTGIAELSGAWINFTSYLSETWVNFKADWLTVWYQISNAFNSVIDSMIGAFYHAWNDAVGWLAKKISSAWGAVRELLGFSNNSGAENASIDRHTAADNRNFDSAIASSEHDDRARLGDVANQRDADTRAIEAKKRDDIAAAQSQLDKATAEFHGLTAQAKSEALTAKAPKAQRAIDAVTPELDKIVKGDVIGTFNSSSVSQLGVGNNVGERIAKAVERTANNTDPSNDKGLG